MSVLTAGTVTRLGGGSIVVTVGTITNGTVQTIGIRHPAEFATIVGGTGTATGTIKAAVAGSVIYVTTLAISAGSAQNVIVASGTPTIPIAGTFFLNANGGVALMPLDPPIRTVSGSALVWNQNGTGPTTITATGYVT